MAITLSSLRDIGALRFDEIIDVRSPTEFADDHLPGAINLPVLGDAERARVGTIYKQVAPFEARKIGAALIARNVARHLEGPLAARHGGWRPLLYCWRGGQRSGSMAVILSQIGWRAEIVTGGYKCWRNLVVRELETVPASPIILLDGNTGSAKTEILHLLAARGIQIIDLEGLANHRGSLFGSRGEQPSQRMFEGRLAHALAALDPDRPVVIEAEGSVIGRCRLPARLWRAMATAPRIEMHVPAAERARYLVNAYRDLTLDTARLSATLEQLRPYHAAERIMAWQALLQGGDYAGFCEGLMAAHYDPRYAKHRARSAVPREVLTVDSLDPAGLATAADRITALVQRRTDARR